MFEYSNTFSNSYQPKKPRLLYSIALILSIGLLSACQPKLKQINDNATNSVQAQDPKAIKSGSLSEIKQLIELSCQSSNQCHAIGINPLACGGYADYLIYSELETPQAALKTQVAQYNQGFKLQQKQQQLSSICLYLEKPKLRCINHICSKQSSRDPT